MFKNAIAAFVFLFISSFTFAQTQKGSFALSGKTNLNSLFSNSTSYTDSIETGKTKSRDFSFSAAAGYFVMDHLNAGIAVSYSYDYSKGNLTGYFISQSRTQSFSVVPQVNYFIPLEGKLKPVVGAGFGYMWLEQRDSRVNDNNNLVYSLDGIAMSGSVGVSYFVLPSVSFDLGVQFSHSDLKDHLYPSQKQKTNSTGGNLGVTVFLK
jgi:outer membrane protein